MLSRKERIIGAIVGFFGGGLLGATLQGLTGSVILSSFGVFVAAATTAVFINWWKEKMENRLAV